MLKINFQMNNNDCGVCVLVSLINYFHKTNISYEQLLQESDLSKNGLTIYDLEIIANQHGINLESYNISFEEFEKYENKKYFILVLNKDEGLHYVIARKYKEFIEIFCSVNGNYKISYHELKQEWCGILIECSKNTFKSKKISINKNIFDQINWKNFFFVNFFNILILVFVIFNTTFLQQIINNVININTLTNILSISLTFLLTFIIKFIGNSLIKLFCYKSIWSNYQQMHFKCLNKIRNKYISFFNKVNINHLRKMDHYLFQTSSFLNLKLNELFSDILIILCGVIFLFNLNWYLSLLILALLMVVTSIDIFRYFYFRKNINKLEEYQNNYDNSLLEFLNDVKNNNYDYYKNENVKEIKDKFLKNKYFINKNLNDEDNFNICENFIFHLFFIFIILLSSYFIVNKKTISLAQLTIIIGMVQMLISSTKSILTILTKIPQYKFSYQIYKNILTVDNKPIRIGIMHLNQISNIEYEKFKIWNDTLITGASGSGKTHMLQQICNMICNDNVKIKFDNLDKTLLNEEIYQNQFIYLNNNSKFKLEKIIELLKKDESGVIKYFIEKLKINNFEQLSFGQRQALVFLSLINEQNKIILLDEVLSNVDNDIKQELIQIIKPIILQNNFLVFVTHDQMLTKQFSNTVVYEQKN